jgi:phage shock protein C
MPSASPSQLVRWRLVGYASLMASSALVRPQNDKWIAGVCSGLANRFGLSTGVVRLLFVLFGLFGAGEIAYIVLWVLMPKG